MHGNQVLIAALFSGTSVAIAADFPPEGKYDFTACWSGVSNPIQFSKTHTAFTYDMTGSSRASQSGAMFDKTSFHCIGLSMVLDGKGSGVTVCEAVDKDGDKLLTRFDQSGTANTRTQISGTGKYEGAAIAGSVEPLGPFPSIKVGTFQNCNHQTGTYKLPKLMK
jgi:hypothetical protein